MSQSPISNSFGCPAELVHSVEQQAESDADAVVVFLDRTGLRGTPMPGSFLLALGAILRARTWEENGIFLHLEDGVLPSEELLADLFERVYRGSVDDVRKCGIGLSHWILEIATTRLAWDGTKAMGAEILLGEINEEILVETLAKLLWANRHGGK